MLAVNRIRDDKRSFDLDFKERISHLQEWCGDHLRALGCFCGSVGQGWDVVEKYIREQDKYEYNSEK